MSGISVGNPVSGIRSKKGPTQTVDSNKGTNEILTTISQDVKQIVSGLIDVTENKTIVRLNDVAQGIGQAVKIPHDVNLIIVSIRSGELQVWLDTETQTWNEGDLTVGSNLGPLFIPMPTAAGMAGKEAKYYIKSRSGASNRLNGTIIFCRIQRG